MQIVIIGAGIIGLHIAQVLSSQKYEIYILEKESYLAEHTSGRNSGVIHAGIFYTQGSLKETFCLEGNPYTYEWVRRLQVPFNPCGKLVILEEHQLPFLDSFLEKLKNLGLEPISIPPSKISQWEAHLRAVHGVFIPTTGVLDAATYVINLSIYLENQGVQILRNCEVKNFHGDQLETSRGNIPFDFCINSAGLQSANIAKLSGIDDYEIKPCRGDYYLLNKKAIFHPVYHLPDPKGQGLGVHLTPTLESQTLLGPNAFFIEEIENYKHLSIPEEFLASLKKELPSYQGSSITPGYSGNRPKLFNKGEQVKDFTIIKQDNWIHLLGIESPGLTSAPAIAKYVKSLL